MASTVVPSKVSVVVVSFNTKEKLRHCLSCIEPSHEVIVVDNASVDGSVEMVQSEFPSVVVIANSSNRGFGPANNQGIDVATRPLVLLLNSDCYASPGAIDSLASVFESSAESPIAAGGKLLNPDKTLQESVAAPLTLGFEFREQTFLDKVFRSNWITGRLACEGAVPVEQVMGACLMMRPVERFDERFFLYVEDTDLCLRLRRRGPIFWVPTAEFVHDLGGSSGGSGRWLSVARYNWGKELYFRIHAGAFASFVCFAMNRFGALLRLLIWLVPTVLTLGLVGRVRGKVVLFARVLFAPYVEKRNP